MSQFLIAAEEQDIGTCINGFVSFFPRRSRNIWESIMRIRFMAQRSSGIRRHASLGIWFGMIRPYAGISHLNC